MGYAADSKMWGKQTCFSRLRWFVEDGQLELRKEMINHVKMQRRASRSGPQQGVSPLRTPQQGKHITVSLNRFVII